mmetsp:Transcript_22056/g.60563  ORF Transcript_22056/g.60563 Transcript_22056/m.60563 type:complete len:102 (+) Transcript_22056:566-871(+)
MSDMELSAVSLCHRTECGRDNDVSTAKGSNDPGIAGATSAPLPSSVATPATASLAYSVISSSHARRASSERRRSSRLGDLLPAPGIWGRPVHDHLERSHGV